MSEPLLQRITLNPEICHGKPCIRDLRYPVEFLLELLSSGMTTEEILADYDDLEADDILASLLMLNLHSNANSTGARRFFMNAIEFQASIKNGMIEIPEQYRQDFEQQSNVKVILIKQVEDVQVNNFLLQLLENPICVEGFTPLTRGETYER